MVGAPGVVACANPALRSSTATRHACGVGWMLHTGRGNQGNVFCNACHERRLPAGDEGLERIAAMPLPKRLLANLVDLFRALAVLP